MPCTSGDLYLLVYNAPLDDQYTWNDRGSSTVPRAVGVFPFRVFLLFQWLIYVSGCRILHMNPVDPIHPLGALLPSLVARNGAVNKVVPPIVKLS